MKGVTMEDLRRLEAEGYTFSEALSLSGIRRVGESGEEWQLRTRRIIERTALNGLALAMERRQA